MTPEGKVKNKIRQLLNVFGVEYDMIVPSGYGDAAKGLDFTCVVRGRAIYIEAKAPGEYPTPLQRQTLRRKYEAGARCFIVSDTNGLASLADYLNRVITLGQDP